MTPISTYRGVVYPWHCDQMGHMNVTWYVSKFDEATWNFVAAIGITPSYLREGHGVAGVQQNITYKRELFAGDIVEIRSRLESIREKTLVFVHEMLEAVTGELSTVCEITAVHMDRNTRKSVPLPAHVRSLAAHMLED